MELVAKLVEAVANKYNRHHLQINIFLILTIVVMSIFGALMLRNTAERDAARDAALEVTQKSIELTQAEVLREKEWANREKQLQIQAQRQVLRGLERELGALTLAAGKIGTSADEVVSKIKKINVSPAARDQLLTAASPLIRDSGDLKDRAQFLQNVVATDVSHLDASTFPVPSSRIAYSALNYRWILALAFFGAAIATWQLIRRK